MNWTAIVVLTLMAIVITLLSIAAWKKMARQRSGRPQPVAPTPVTPAAPQAPTPGTPAPVAPQPSGWRDKLKAVWNVAKWIIVVVLIGVTWRCGTEWAGADRAGHRQPTVEVVKPGSDYYEAKTVTITPTSPLVVSVDPGYKLEAWHDENLTKSNVERKGTTMVTTISATGEFHSEATFVLFRCNVATPCK